ncbi:exodeoxyribonuclease V subunit alpha [Acidithiobacillus montserratensis]|uniref:Exodeoxyribonuclease V subunit alpha n=1 Tax=Acidithiobacillus montserratensis TaxID=2729135 RepID=A0ACD5HFR5_9PROT|nr:exodeoxyribonuclease V subunit alpha [Acidithiobacillaceae bacterium]
MNGYSRQTNTAAMMQLLQSWTASGWLRMLDLSFARFLLSLEIQPPALLPLAAALLAHLEGEGHTCLDIARFLREPARYLSGPPEMLSAIQEQLQHWPDLQPWIDQLSPCRVVTQIDQQPGATPEDGSETPLVLDQGCLYLRRYWRDARDIARSLTERVTCSIHHPVQTESLHPLLSLLFPNDAATARESVPWQKIACALAMRGRFSIITGGPGTGKTYTAARLMALLMAQAREPLRIVLAAPTGKAAVRINESLHSAIAQLPPLGHLNAAELSAAFTRLGPARTLHSLLGAKPGTRRLRHDRQHPLDLDVLIVDEASMIHQEMMAALLRALPEHAQLILLGDQDQLASVEAGAVLADLCSDAGAYDPDTCTWLQATCDCPLEARHSHINPLSTGVVRLQRSHRFNAGIGALADAVQQGATASAMEILHREDVLDWYNAPEIPQILQLVDSAAGYRPLWDTVRQGGGKVSEEHTLWVQRVLKKYAAFRLLCALREGPWGVTGINQAVEDHLQETGTLNIQGLWYVGRPVLMTRNDPQLSLSNGDIGITLPDPEGKWRVYFPAGDASPRVILPSRLKYCESAWAMTVHKSQGSEFQHTALILPPQDSPVTSRELLYTAITRAREIFSLFAPATGLEQAIARRTQRMSGLLAALQKASKYGN